MRKEISYPVVRPEPRNIIPALRAALAELTQQELRDQLAALGYDVEREVDER